MKNLSFLYACAVFLKICNCARFAKFTGTGNRYLGNVKYLKTARTEVDCARVCSTHNACKSFNFLEIQTGEKRCEFFETIPTNIVSELAYLHGSETSTFYEKICRVPGLVNSAAEAKSEEENYNVYVGLGAGDVIYSISISKNLTSHTEVGQRFEDLATLTGGYVTSLDSVANVYVPEISNNSPLTWITTGNMVLCQLRSESNDIHLCPGSWPKHVKELSNQALASADAILPRSINGTGLWVFANEKIYKCSTTKDLKWTVERDFLVGKLSLGNIWVNAPSSTTAAAWLDFELSDGEPKETMAALFTRDYFVVYNTTFQGIVYRGRICFS